MLIFLARKFTKFHLFEKVLVFLEDLLLTGEEGVRFVCIKGIQRIFVTSFYEQRSLHAERKFIQISLYISLNIDNIVPKITSSLILSLSLSLSLSRCLPSSPRESPLSATCYSKRGAFVCVEFGVWGRVSGMGEEGV